MVQILCLANSWRPGGRCVAGLDLETGHWIRPVPAFGGAIPLHVAGQFGLLDIVEMDLRPPHMTTRFQPENRVAVDWNWRVVAKAAVGDVIGLVDNTTPIFYGDGDRVEPEIIARLPLANWKSLQLVRPQNLRFAGAGEEWRAYFDDAAHNHYGLKVKDPAYLDRLNAGQHDADCLITVSLTEPWGPPDGTYPEHCYKLAAAVIPV